MDKITQAARSANMSKIRSKDTKPEIVIRSMLHKMGYRFRLHRKDLPGKPDIVLPRHHKIILVHGCFWHGHTCILASKPKSNTEYWQNKIHMNKMRDDHNSKLLRDLGWSILVLWECDIRANTNLKSQLETFMNS